MCNWRRNHEFSPDESLPFGDPPLIEHTTPNSVTEIGQRLIPFPFTPPDVRLDDKEALSTSNDWFTKHDKKKIDELDSLDFYASTGTQCVGVVPKLHNTSAGIEIYRLPPTKRSQNLKHTLSRNRRSPAFVRLGCSAILSRCHRRRIAQWMSGNSKRSAIKPEKPAIRVARKRGRICEAGCNREIPNWFYRVDRDRTRFRMQFSMALWRHLAEAN